jgi:type IX secretion system PorP/SprF family membrane protein
MKGNSHILILLLIILLFVWGKSANAQQLPQYSQYVMNKFLINPAVAGSEGYTAFNITAREQWIGLQNSPRTYAISAQTRVLKNSFVRKSSSIRRRSKGASRSGKVGLGGYIFNDQTGLVNRTGIKLTYAYHITMHRGQLSFGLSGTIFQFKLEKDQFIMESEDDLLLNNSGNALFIPDADFGVYYSDPQIYAGFSASQLLESSLKFGNQGYENYRLQRHYYLMGGYAIDINDYLIIVPNVLMKMSEALRFQADIGARMYFFEDYWGGLSFRTGGAFSLMGGVKIDKFFIGYAFDYNLNHIMKHSYGSHEFMVAVKFGDSARRYRWLNRY